MRHRIGLTVLLAAGIASASSLVADLLHSPTEPIRIGVNSWPPCDIWYVAREQGYFGDLDVELIRFGSWSANMQSMYAGKTDVTHATWFNAAYYAGRGEPATVIQAIDTVEGGDGLVIRGPSGPAPDLRGLRIAVEVNTDEHFLLERALQDFGLRLQDVEPVSISSKAGTTAFVEDRVDAVFTYEPFLSEAARDGDGRIVWTTRQRPGYMVDVLTARGAVLDARPGDVRALLGAWNRSLAWIREHPDDAMAIMARAEGMTATEFRPFFESFTFYSADANRSILTPAGAGRTLSSMLAFLRDRGTIAYGGSVADLYSAAYLPQEAHR